MTNPRLLAHERRKIAEAVEESKRGMQVGMGIVRVSSPLLHKMLALIDYYEKRPAKARCFVVKSGEYDRLRCCRPEGHDGPHNYVVDETGACEAGGP